MFVFVCVDQERVGAYSAQSQLQVIRNDDSLFPFGVAGVTRLPTTHTSKFVYEESIS